MIYLTKGQKLTDNPSMVVYDQTGYYNDGDSIICASAAMPNEPLVRYEAKFIAYGGMVYSISNTDELLAEVMKLDPDSLFGKDSKQVAVDKVVEDIVPQESGDTPSTEQVEETEVTENTETSEVAESATTTPPIIAPPSNISTTTPTTIEESNPSLEVPTTTPEAIFPNISTPEENKNNNATSSDTTNIDDVITEKPEILDESAATTTAEVVAFAKKLVKKKISNKLGL